MDRRLFVALTASMLLLAAMLPVAAVAKEPSGSKVATYIVQMEAAPAVAYTGGIDGLAATQPANGKKIDPASAKVQKYVDYLKGRHAAAIAKLAGAIKIYDYVYTFNGFAARMTGSQAAQLEKTPGVAAVSKDRLNKLDTSTTPTFLGLDAADGLWSQLGGVGSAGEDVIVGVVDSGIWPEHPSFSDQTDLKFRKGSSGKRLLAYDAPPVGWSGTCQSGEQFSQDMCTNKLIGARYYLSGFGHFGIVKNDYKSPRDHDSHGSHTASTAAGNFGVQATGVAAPFGKISGMAPRARIAAYKVCWNGDDGGCTGSDSVAAIDQAVADGVDVINFSISGTSANFLDPVEVAFLFAADAGVFVAASAGNSGEAASTVNHPSPWLTTVAASTHSRASEATLTLGNGATYTGASSNLSSTTGSVVLSTASGFAGADATHVRLCVPGTLDPAKVTGKIVVCDRGVIARVDKSRAVKQAGGIGMILANPSADSLHADLHFVPTIHIDHVAGAAVKAYVTSAGTAATATIGAVSGAAPAPKMAAFSSRGPSLGAGGDLLKPDLTAPGVDVLAAVSPDSGREFDLLSGTSMSSPHVAGLGALLTDAHPTWSPAAIKSALMTSAYDTIDFAGDPFAQGAGHVKPNSAVSPGLVYDLAFVDFRNFLKGQGLCNFCFGATPATAVDASDLNVASIAIGDLTGVQTVTRRVTNVGPAGTYTVSVAEPAGIDVQVSPSSLTFAAGETKTFTVTITRETAAFGTYQSGSLTWVNGTRTVRSPIVVRAVGIAAPATFSGTGAAGTTTFEARSGFTGTLSFSARGLAPAATATGSVADDPTNTFAVDGAGVSAHTVTVPADTTYARFSLFDANVGPGTGHDLDLYVYKGDTLIDSSESVTSREEVNLVDPPAGDYTVYVHGWQTAGGVTANYTLFSWSLGASGAGTYLTLPAPRAVTAGTNTSIAVSWSGLATATKYLGILDYSDGTNAVGSTVLRIDVP